MVTPRRMPRRWILGLSGLALLWLTMLLLGGGPVDTLILRSLYVGHIPAVATAARAVTFLGGGYFVTAVIAAASLAVALRKKAWLALVLIVGTSTGRLLVEIQKYEISRLRPFADPHLVEVHSLSFPSAHSANAVMTYLSIALLLVPADARRLWVVVAAALAFLIGISRVLLGVHWPSDVVGGWSFGLLWTMLIYAISQRRTQMGRVE